jgi:Lipid A 3-O-deacylase (PagL)
MLSLKQVFFVASILAFSTKAQQTLKPLTTRSIGIDLGLGFQNIGQIINPNKDIWGLNTPYFYKVHFIEFQYEQELRKIGQYPIYLSIKPQWNRSEYKEENDDEKLRQGFESGINLGLKIKKKRNTARPGFWFAELSVGPHFISGAPRRQSVGFIFSDNLSAGLEFQTSKRMSNHLSMGFRHVSNAGIQNPNGGINTIFIKIGTSISLNIL